MENNILISEVLLSVMSRLFGRITLFSGYHGRIYSNGIEVWQLLDGNPPSQKKIQIY